MNLLMNLKMSCFLMKSCLNLMNEGKKKEDWEKDEHGNVITVEVAG